MADGIRVCTDAIEIVLDIDMLKDLIVDHKIPVHANMLVAPMNSRMTPRRGDYDIVG